MRLRNRFKRIQKELPPPKLDKKEQERDLALEWLVQNNQEFKECFKQFYRLQYKTEQPLGEWKRWKEPYRGQAFFYIEKMEELFAKHQRHLIEK